MASMDASTTGTIDTSEAMTLLILLTLFAGGLCVGSFLNVVIERLPRGESVIKGRSYCERCHHQLAWSDLIPVFSFVFLRGKCCYCGQKISWQYPLIELLTAVSMVSVVSMASMGEPLPLTLLTLLTQLTLVAILIAIAVIDLKHGVIPDKLVYPAIGLVVGSRLLTGLELRPLLWTLLGSLVLYSSFFILHSLFKGRALGGGDVKLAFLVGFVAGWPNMIVAVFAAFLTGALVSVILMLLHKKKFGETVPFGPFLVVGTYIALLFGEDILKWYLGLL